GGNRSDASSCSSCYEHQSPASATGSSSIASGQYRAAMPGTRRLTSKPANKLGQPATRRSMWHAQRGRSSSGSGGVSPSSVSIADDEEWGRRTEQQHPLVESEESSVSDNQYHCEDANR